eukprot:1634279-Rhodomonas_salina.1
MPGTAVAYRARCLGGVRLCYGMSGTERGYVLRVGPRMAQPACYGAFARTRRQPALIAVPPLLSAYARATPYPVPHAAICYSVPGTTVRYLLRRPRYHTTLPATPCPVLTERMVLSGLVVEAGSNGQGVLRGR